MIYLSLNKTRFHRDHRVEAVFIMGGNILGGTNFPMISLFCLEALEAEIKSNKVLGVLLILGWLLAKGILETNSGDPVL